MTLERPQSLPDAPVILGIDPGKDGYVCALCAQSPFFYETPVLRVGTKGNKRDYFLGGMRGILDAWRSLTHLVILEKQQVMPGQGVSSSGQIMYGYGLWLGLLVGLDMSCRVVHPRTWQAALHRDVPGDDPKSRSIIAASRLFPTVDLRATERCKKPHDGKADSLLLAYYGQQLGSQLQNIEGA